MQNLTGVKCESQTLPKQPNTNSVKIKHFSKEGSLINISSFAFMINHNNKLTTAVGSQPNNLIMLCNF